MLPDDVEKARKFLADVSIELRDQVADARKNGLDHVTYSAKPHMWMTSCERVLQAPDSVWDEFGHQSTDFSTAARRREDGTKEISLRHTGGPERSYKIEVVARPAAPGISLEFTVHLEK